jgi:hypothetical protein
MSRTFADPDNHKPGVENKDVLKCLHQEFFSVLRPLSWTINQYEASINAIKVEGRKTEELKLYYMFGHRLVLDVSTKIRTSTGQKVRSKRITVDSSETLTSTLLSVLSESHEQYKGYSHGDPQGQNSK